MERASTSGRLGLATHLGGKTNVLLPARRQTREQRQLCRAGMGIGFHPQDSGLVLPPSFKAELEVQPEFGLTVAQMRVLGLSNEAMAKLPTVEAVSFFF